MLRAIVLTAIGTNGEGVNGPLVYDYNVSWSDLTGRPGNLFTQAPACAVYEATGPDELQPLVAADTRLLVLGFEQQDEEGNVLASNWDEPISEEHQAGIQGWLALAGAGADVLALVDSDRMETITRLQAALRLS